VLDRAKSEAMNISLLVFGSDNFRKTLPNQIHDIDAFNVEVITNWNEAIGRLQLKPPDIILIQASLNDGMDLCCWIKEQTNLSSIYCIVLEDRPQVLADKIKYGCSWEMSQCAEVIEQGADAYIWMLPEDNSLYKDEQTKVLAPYDQLLVAHLSVAVRKVQKYRDLQRQNDLLSAIALSDPLTELNNRRALEWELPRQIQKANNHGIPLSLIILDVDYFKKINDTYGHLIGDRILQLLSKRLRHNLRLQDIPFRYGGEEFVIIISNTSPQEALRVAQRLNRVVHEQPFAVNKELSINISISLGISSLQPEDDPKGSSLLDRADKCLLKAKATGRNCVVGCESFVHSISSAR
jgi:diguanylate cyclase (GGDEF)-like protein